ncbi:hypothetical protein [Trinickia sp. Y13]|uniref:hypothetical protein n=1 Tax=Trinickia sp. Y13 TaxID=2917807 RepID=UPI002404D9B1|nr:hypothetical protein [Trinickia sp. Y13]MDG0026455.1 hypothetical protein [Trinickia sp. Y13]
MKRALLCALAGIRRVCVRLPAARRSTRWGGVLRAPAQRRSVKRRLMICTALAAVAFTLASFAGRTFDAGRARGAAAIDELERQLREGRVRLARMPELREASLAQVGVPSNRSAGGELPALAELAAKTGLTLRLLEPLSQAGPARDGGDRAGRALRIEGRSDFAGLYGFLQGLPALPVLVVPQTLSIKREPGALAIAGTLSVFDVSPARPRGQYARAVSAGTGGGKRQPLADPFGAAQADSVSALAGARLVGFVQDGRRSLALLEGASGTQAAVVGPGQSLGAERVVGIDSRGVTLASRHGARRISLQDDHR